MFLYKIYSQCQTYCYTETIFLYLCTRCVVKVSQILCFSKIIYLFLNIYFVPFKVIPPRYTLMPTFFQIVEALQKIIFCALVHLLLRYGLYLLYFSVASSFHGLLQFRGKKKEKSQGARCGEYGGCGITSVLFLAQKQRTSNAV